MSSAEPLRLRCRVCLIETNHVLLYREDQTEYIENEDIEAEQYGDRYTFHTIYRLVKCAGCDDIRLRVENVDDYFGNTHRSSSTYPPDQIRHMPKWVYGELRVGPKITRQPDREPGLRALHQEIRDYLTEIYGALGASSYRLAMMGIRALIERIMIHEIGDRHSFERNVTAFFEKGFVADIQQAMFKDALLEAGHAAMHRGWNPSFDHVETLLDITESLIRSIYVDRRKASDLARQIIPRVPRIPRI